MGILGLNFKTNSCSYRWGMEMSWSSYLFLFIAFLLVLAGSLCYDTVCRTQQHHKPETSYLHFWSYLSFCSDFISANYNGKNIPPYPCRKHLGWRRSSFTQIRTRIIKVEYICPLLNWTCNSMPLACLIVFGLISLIFVLLQLLLRQSSKRWWHLMRP